MEFKESSRQKKFSSLLKKELAHLFQGLLQNQKNDAVIISITKVFVSSDLSSAKIYVSIFPSKSNKKYLEALRDNTPMIKHSVAQRLKSFLRKMPELAFYIDDSLDYIEKINETLKNPYNPIKNKLGNN
jgi:ribosome-binding factor A